MVDPKRLFRTDSRAYNAAIAVFLTLALVASLAGVALASQAIIDDFEDGNSWGSDTKTSQSRVYHGNYSLTHKNYGIELSGQIINQNFSTITYNININKASPANSAGDQRFVSDTNNVIAYVSFEEEEFDVGTQTNIATLELDQWYEVVYEFNYSAQTYTVSLYNATNGTRIVKSSPEPRNAGSYTLEDISQVNIEVHDQEYIYWDWFRGDYGSEFTEPVQGTVTDDNGKPIEGATVSTNTSTSTTTSSSGLYSLSLDKGTYNITASKNGYTSSSKTVTVTDFSNVVDFTLTNLNETLKIKVKRFLKHGRKSQYEVINKNETTGDTTYVTDNATVTSGNTDLLTVESALTQVLATSNESRTGTVELTADYDNKTATETIFVGDITLNNFEKLPPWARFDSVINSRTDGGESGRNNATTLILLVAAFAGAVFRQAGSTYYGLGAFESIIILGWIMGKVNNGVLLVSLVAVGFVALNLAANIDYGFSGTR